VGGKGKQKEAEEGKQRETQLGNKNTDSTANCAITVQVAGSNHQ
jgi:hypothetical protein